MALRDARVATVGAQHFRSSDARSQAATHLALLHVLDVDAVTLGGGLELLAEGVLANAADEGGRARHAAHPLRHADRVLRRTARNVLDLVRLGELSVEWLVLVLGEDGIVELDAPPGWQQTAR